MANTAFYPTSVYANSGTLSAYCLLLLLAGIPVS